MGAPATGEIVDGLWRFEADHPDWTEEEWDGGDGWERTVSWWAVASRRGLVMIDPLITDWDALDTLVHKVGGCAGIVRTIHWHQRSVAEVCARYGAQVWARGGASEEHFDHQVADRDELFGAITAFDVERADELALWLPVQRALLFGDAMLRRRGSGELRVCPDSWGQPEGGPRRLRELLRGLAELPVEHVLVSHGPFVLGDGAASLRAATGAQ